MKNALLLFAGHGFESQGSGRFVKDVLAVGTWIHPATQQRVEITRDRLLKLAQNTERYRKNVDKQVLPFPDGHSLDAMDNLGEWPGPFFVHGDRLYGVVEPKGAEVVERLTSKKIRSVSAMIKGNCLDSKGNVYDEVIVHVCATNYPVITGQQDFVQLSADTKDQELYIPMELAGTSPEGNRNKEGRMDLKAMAKALGLPEETPADKVLEAATKAGQAATKLSALETKATQEQTSLAAELKAQGFELKDGKIVKLAAASTTPSPTDDAEKAELKTRLATLEKSQALSAIGSAKAQAEKFISEGRVPPAVRAELERVLSLAGKVEVLSLASDGNPVRAQVELLSDITKIFGSLQKISELGLSGHGGDAGSDEGKAAEKKAQEVLNRLQPAKK